MATPTPVTSFTSLHCLYNSSSCLLREDAWSLVHRIKGRLISPNNVFLMDDPLAPNCTMDLNLDLPPARASIRTPRRPVPGGTGDAWLPAWLLQGNGWSIGSEAQLGCCAQLPPGI